MLHTLSLCTLRPCAGHQLHPGADIQVGGAAGQPLMGRLNTKNAVHRNKPCMGLRGPIFFVCCGVTPPTLAHAPSSLLPSRSYGVSHYRLGNDFGYLKIRNRVAFKSLEEQARAGGGALACVGQREACVAQCSALAAEAASLPAGALPATAATPCRRRRGWARRLRSTCARRGPLTATPSAC